MGRELEIKYRLTRQQYAAMLGDHPALSETAMQTVYYDTPDGALGRRLWTLRRRQEGSRSICTCKIPLPDGSRGEWEAEEQDIFAALPRLVSLGAPRELLSLGELRPHCGARFCRSFGPIVLPGGEAELAIDQGVLTGGSRELPLLEAELELKQGPDSLLWELDRLYTARYGLEKEPRSKLARAAALNEQRE